MDRSAKHHGENPDNEGIVIGEERRIKESALPIRTDGFSAEDIEGVDIFSRSRKLVSGVIEEDSPGDVNALALVLKHLELKKFNNQLLNTVGILHEEVDEANTIDKLTGLKSLKGIEDCLPQILALDKRNGESTTLVFLDLDNFKKINDTIGYGKADREILIPFANLLQKHLRETDIKARRSGDEFVLVLPRTSLNDVGFIEKILNKIITNLNQQLAKNISGSIKLTASVGIISTSLKEFSESSPEELLCAAGGAASLAKDGGKACLFIVDSSKSAKRANARFCLEQKGNAKE